MIDMYILIVVVMQLVHIDNEKNGINIATKFLNLLLNSAQGINILEQLLSRDI